MAGIILCVLFGAAGIVVSIIPVTVLPSARGERSECGTAFFTDGPPSCDGANTRYAIVAIVLFTIAAAAGVRVVNAARRGPERSEGDRVSRR